MRFPRPVIQVGNSQARLLDRMQTSTAERTSQHSDGRKLPLHKLDSRPVLPTPSICVSLVTTAGFNSSRQPGSHFALQPSHGPLAKFDALRESSFRLHLVDHGATEPSELGYLP